MKARVPVLDSGRLNQSGWMASAGALDEQAAHPLTDYQLLMAGASARVGAGGDG